MNSYEIARAHDGRASQPLITMIRLLAFMTMVSLVFGIRAFAQEGVVIESRPESIIPVEPIERNAAEPDAADTVSVPVGNEVSVAPRSIEQRLPVDRLQTGMSFHDVVRLLGAPTERREFESRRQDTWYYGDRVRGERIEVFFQEGKVVAWTGAGSERPPRSGVTQNSPDGVDAESLIHDKDVLVRDPSAIEQILSEIVKTPAAESIGQASPE